jgi:[protein-PII] uridylyltransferase
MQAHEHLETGVREEDWRDAYARRMLEIRGAFDAGAAGAATIAARAQAVDDLVRAAWLEAVDRNGRLSAGVALVATGGYGRRELFPQSDVDLLFLLDNKMAETLVKDSIRQVNQELWDLGVRVSPATRKVAEFTLSLLDHRLIAGNAALYERAMGTQGLLRLLQRENKAILGRLLEMTRARHMKYGDTLFHLEPNIKDCPGGLRDVHVCGWIARLGQAMRPARRAQAQGDEIEVVTMASGEEEFREAVEFLFTVRCFLHYRHERDDNTLDWRAQDMAAEAAVGLPRRLAGGRPDAAYWMRIYFRHARSIDRRVAQSMDSARPPQSAIGRLRAFKLRRPPEKMRLGYRIEQGRLVLDTVTAHSDTRYDPAHDPDTVLHAFAEIAASGEVLGPEAEERLSQALPLLSSQLEEGAALWLPLRAILTGRHAGDALRAMHAIGMLELLIPEFHGIDALVIRDAYHRYTVDEHTFVTIDTLHGLSRPVAAGMAEWAGKFSVMLRDLAHPELLYLGALLHDTGKGRSSGDHAGESVRLARSVLERLELDDYESGLVLSLIENHLEMSAALRRDIFDAATVRAFAGKVNTPEALRMLTLFTYADIAAVNPDALTPWKAENIWRLYMATSNFLDRSVDDERVTAQAGSELVDRVVALDPGSRAEVVSYLDGFPERYLRTRTPEQVRAHFEMTTRFERDAIQLEFRYAPGVSEITLVTRDRPLLFATMAGALAAWGMNIVTADAFSNRGGVVVDSFRFTDSFRTLELNASEHERFVASAHDVLSGKVSLDKLLSGRHRPRLRPPMVVVDQRVDFDDLASLSSTLMQVVAQDVPGLLRALSLTLAAHGCNIEVALVDTEGEMAIDVFYLTKDGGKLRPEEEAELRGSLLAAMTALRPPHPA